jgi:hypothetical protein
LYNIYNFIITEWLTTITRKGVSEQHQARRRRREEWWTCERNKTRQINECPRHRIQQDPAINNILPAGSGRLGGAGDPPSYHSRCMMEHRCHEKESTSSTEREGEGKKNGASGETKIKGNKIMKVLATVSSEIQPSIDRIRPHRWCQRPSILPFKTMVEHRCTTRNQRLAPDEKEKGRIMVDL